MIFKCLICDKSCPSNRSLSGHIRLHHITVKQYQEKFQLIPRCKTCNQEVSGNCKTGYCTHCRDRSGENNPFYGKKHKSETIENAKIKCTAASKKNWENPEYRDKVIKGVSKPRKESFGPEQSVRVTQWYIDNPIQIQIRSDSMKKNWLNGNIVRNGYACNRSAIQEKLLKDVEDIYGHTITGKTIRLATGKYLFPDIFVPNIGLIIEFYGNFWHANPKNYKPNDIVVHGASAKEIWDKDERRIRKFGDAIDDNGNCVSYRTVIIWERDYLDNRNNVLISLDSLINWEGCG